MPAFLSSVRIAIRTLARNPTVTSVAVLSLAVGIGVNAAVFSVVDAVFLRPPAVRDPYGIVNVVGMYRDSGPTVFDWPDCETIRTQSSAFSDMAA